MTARDEAGDRAVRLAVIAERLGGEPRDLVVEASPASPSGDVVTALAGALGVDGDEPGSATAFSPRLGRLLARDEPFVEAVRHGDRLVLAAGPTAPPAPPPGNGEAGPMELAVVGGPRAGRRFGLGVGEHAVGRDARCAVALDDPSLSRTHVRIRVGADTVALADAGSRNGTLVEAQRLASGEERLLVPGELVRAGRNLLAVEPRREAREVEHRGGYVEVNRPMRAAPRFEPPERRLSPPPEEPSRQSRMGLLSSLPFALMGVVLWLVTGSVLMLLFVAVSPLMVVLFYVEDRWGGKRTYARLARRYRQQLAELKADLDAARDAEVRQRRQAAPSPAELAARAHGRHETLWERRLEDDDFLALRVGSADSPALGRWELDPGGSTELRDEAAELLDAYATAPAVPVCVSFAEAGTLGVSGRPDPVAAFARSLVLQAATLHSPRDLVVAAALDDDGAAAWSWLKWLPHALGEVTPLAAQLGAGAVEARRVLEDVLRLRNERRTALEETFHSSTRSSPQVLLVVQEEAAPERALVASLLSDAARYGIAVLWLGRDRRGLPGECGAVVELDERAARLTHRDGRSVQGILADGVDADLAQEWALALAPLRDVTSSAAGGGIPDRIGLADVLGVETVSARWVEARWRDAQNGLGAPVGAAADGRVELDLREHGPHGLVAGITGAGKSELLQTLIASLAASYPPTKLQFLLVDYKGGLAFKECVDLPHATLVTDLDEHLTQRALASLRAEQRRREALLREAGAKDLPELERKRPDVALPNLVIVIDEFAGLAEELPDFIDGVVDVARRGRALGVHLLLATQRPGGIVSQQIRANTNLRLALRVNEPGESIDVIGVPDAARIARHRPGRAYMLTGHGERELTEFQTAYAGETSAVADEPREPEVRDFRFGGDGRGPARSSRSRPRRTTNLHELVHACREASASMSLEPPAPPWLPPLEPVIPLAALPEPPLGAPDPNAVAVLGLLDEPEQQRQSPFVFDLETDGSLLVFGGGASGKSTLLRTLAAALAQRSSPEELHVYGLDFATRALTPLETLPHCGGVIAADDEERVERLLAQLRGELERRKALFAERGVFTLAELRRTGGPVLPRILVLLDGYGGFADAFFSVRGGEAIDLFARLVAEGRPLGLHFAITSDRRGAVPNALAAIIPTKVVLQMAEEDEFVALGVALKTARAARLSPGRGFVAGHEVQLAMLSDDPAAEREAEALDELAAELRDRHGTARAPEVRLLPLQVEADELPPPAKPMQAFVGFGNTELRPVAVDLAERHFLVCGPYKSGRTSALRLVVEALRETMPALELHLLAPRRSELSELDVWTSSAAGVAECEASVERLAALEANAVIVVDDGEELADALAATALGGIVRRGRDHGVRVLAAVERQVALSSFSPWLMELRKEKHGLLLEPDLSVDGDILGVVLPRRLTVAFPVGRGFLVDRGSFELVQLARPGRW